MGCLRRRLCLGGTRTLPFLRRFSPKEIEAATRGFTAVLEPAGPPRGAATAYRARFAGGLVATVVRRADRRRGDGSSTAAFYLELQLLARLNHRHVVRLRGFADGRHARSFFPHSLRLTELCELLCLLWRVGWPRPLPDPCKLSFQVPGLRSHGEQEPQGMPPRSSQDAAGLADQAAGRRRHRSGTVSLNLSRMEWVPCHQEYLYYHCDPPVFHVSLNSGNVLMDANFVAKLSDVGVICNDIKLATTDSFQDQVAQRRAGLVFQYGVLVLELVTGQSPGGDGELVSWVQEPGFAGSMHRMVDADLGGVYDARELRDLVIVARLCTRQRHGEDGGDAAVSIPQIVRYLQGKVERLRCETRCA